MTYKDYYSESDAEAFLLKEYGGIDAGTTLERIDEEIASGLFTSDDFITTIQHALSTGYGDALDTIYRQAAAEREQKQ